MKSKLNYKAFVIGNPGYSSMKAIVTVFLMSWLGTIWAQTDVRKIIDSLPKSQTGYTNKQQCEKLREAWNKWSQHISKLHSECLSSATSSNRRIPGGQCTVGKCESLHVAGSYESKASSKQLSTCYQEVRDYRAKQDIERKQRNAANAKRQEQLQAKNLQTMRDRQERDRRKWQRIQELVAQEKAEATREYLRKLEEQKQIKTGPRNIGKSDQYNKDVENYRQYVREKLRGSEGDSLSDEDAIKLGYESTKHAIQMGWKKTWKVRPVSPMNIYLGSHSNPSWTKIHDGSPKVARQIEEEELRKHNEYMDNRKLMGDKFCDDYPHICGG
ncbi:hypothetical protein ACFL17_05000 [Pseudomonadota bacterium]